ncbi:hypothetical protein Leryth_009810 [Lithospermum erythrorhizon]|nr:hypothetical protein Leryth_009810 [Lithospermum erythrorhizon]
MTTSSSYISVMVLLLITLTSTLSPSPTTHAFPSAVLLTIAVSSHGGATTICSIVAEQPIQQIQCFRQNQTGPIPVFPSISFDFIAGGGDVFCGVRSGGAALLCWDVNFVPKRIYFNESAPLASVAIGDSQVCGLSSSGDVVCWRGSSFSGVGVGSFRSISSGLGFSCGVLERNSSVVCWGDNADMASRIQASFVNTSMENVFVGGRHACGISSSGLMICEGNNDNE